MASEAAEAAVVPKSDFDALWEEFESFKHASNDIETALEQQALEQEKELKRLSRLLADEQSDKTEYRTRLSAQVQNDQELHKKIHDLEALVASLNATKRKLEDQLQSIETAHRSDAFHLHRLENERDAALDRAIIAESRAEELEEERNALRGELQRTRDSVCVSQQDASATQQALAIAATAREDAMRDMKLVAERLRRIAERCGGGG